MTLDSPPLRPGLRRAEAPCNNFRARSGALTTGRIPLLLRSMDRSRTINWSKRSRFWYWDPKSARPHRPAAEIRQTLPNRYSSRGSWANSRRRRAPSHGLAARSGALELWVIERLLKRWPCNRDPGTVLASLDDDQHAGRKPPVEGSAPARIGTEPPAEGAAGGGASTGPASGASHPNRPR